MICVPELLGVRYCD